MEISKKQASEALDQIQQVAKQTKGELKYRYVGAILILWGVIWLVCFSITHFKPKIAGWAWLVGDCIGLGITAFLAWKAAKKSPVLSEKAKREGRRFGWFWFSLFVFADIWLAVLWPWSGNQLGVFLVTLVMFAYVAMGLWLEMWFMFWLGLVVTILATGIYFLSFLFPGYLNICLAVAGGGALTISGIYLMRKWG